jgi:hypothetical protein
MGITVDLSGMKMAEDCKVCNMHIWNMSLFLRVHDLKIVKGWSNQAIQKVVNVEIAKHNKLPENKPKKNQVLYISDSAFQTHFANHVSAPLALNGKIKSQIVGVLANKIPFPESVEDAINNIHATAEANNLDLMQSFHKLVDKVSKRFDQVEANIAKTGKMSLDDIASFRVMADLLAKLMKDVIQLRNQDKILNDALSMVMDTFSMGALENILKSMDLLFEEYKQQFKDPAIAEELVSKLRAKLGEGMVASAKVALANVRQSMRA